ncbi:MAG: Cache 3/Cache 2 fusion domain-containing protein [Chloroflexota bacterium]
MNTPNKTNPRSWLTRFRSLKLGARILLFGISSVLITDLVLVGVIAWQSSQFNALAQDEFGRLVDSDLKHIVDGVYNMVEAQDELVQQMVGHNLNVARSTLESSGAMSLGQDDVEWLPVNQFTQETLEIRLPKMLVGDDWLGQNTDTSIETPVVDQIQSLVGGAATIFQRMNEQGDMLRVATNVQTADGKRAIGTYIPAIMEDGSPNPVVSTVLSGETYHGEAYVVNAWYDAAYEPILDESGRVIGMLFVGVKQQNVESLRRAILETKVGEAGYVYVLGSDGNELGHYIISEGGQRDGEDIWEEQDAEGNYIIQSIVNKAVALEPGETTTIRYQWQNPGDPAPRWKIAHLAYYAPWHWVIGVSAYEDELATYRKVLEDGQLRMLVISGGVGLAIALVSSLLSIFIAGSISRPVGNLAAIATQISAGNLGTQAKIAGPPEIAQMAVAFNEMTARLREMIGSLEQRVAERTKALATSTEVSRRLSTIVNRRALLVEVVQQVKEAFGYYHAHIYLYDDKKEMLVMAGGTGDAGAAMLAQGHSLPKGRGLVGRAAEINKAVLVPDTSQDPAWLPNPLLPETKSEVAIPISVGDEVLGVLDVQHNVTDGLGQEDVDALQAIASQVAVGMQNIEAAETVVKRAAELQTVASITSITSTIQNADEMLNTVVHLTQRQFGLYHAHVFTFNEKSGNLEIVACGWKQGEEHTGTHGTTAIPLTQEQSLVARAGRTRQAVVVNDVHSEPGWLPNPMLPDTASELAVPMIVGDQLLGVLDVQSDRLNAFTQEDANIQTTLASAVASALQNARSVAEVRQRAERETAINLITQKIQNASTVEAALQVAARELSHALGMKPTLVVLEPEESVGGAHAGRTPPPPPHTSETMERGN